MRDEVSDILKYLPKDQWDEVMNQPECDIEPVFMGFMDVYKSLASIIPEHFTVIDFGASYNPQCFYFRDHKKYIAVEPWEGIKMFRSSNCDIFNMTSEAWINQYLHTVNINETFAICSYVPPWGKDSITLVKNNFRNIFTYYPHGGKPIIPKL